MLKPIYDDEMNLIGRTDENGTFFDAASGRIEGWTGADGTSYDRSMNLIGRGDEDGTVMDASGNITGWSPDGMVVQSSGQIGGWVGSHADQPGDGRPDRTRDVGAIARLSNGQRGQPSFAAAHVNRRSAGSNNAGKASTIILFGGWLMYSGGPLVGAAVLAVGFTWMTMELLRS